MRTVAYQGNPAYLGRWQTRIVEACREQGLVFEINPTDLRTADVIVALRDGPWDGWMCRQWKSGVKLVNAIAAGRPVITQACAAEEEILPPRSTIETAEDLQDALAAWRDPLVRQTAAETCADLAPRYQPAAVASVYGALLQGVVVHA